MLSVFCPRLFFLRLWCLYYYTSFFLFCKCEDSRRLFYIISQHIKLKNKYFLKLLTSFPTSDIIILFLLRICFRGIAQLVEQRSPKPRAEGSSPSAPATFEVRKRRSYVFCGHFAILCFLVLNAFLDGIFVRFRPVFSEKCRISVV